MQFRPAANNTRECVIMAAGISPAVRCFSMAAGKTGAIKEMGRSLFWILEFGFRIETAGS
jgi:hypothetical protein